MRKATIALAIAVIATTLMGAPALNAKVARPAARPAAKPAASLPIFEFLGQNTETPTTMTQINGVPCSPDEPGQVKCLDVRNPEIAGVRLKFLAMYYNGGNLYHMFGSGARFAFSPLLSAFTTKYGTPVIESRKWQNRMGATFDNSVAVWKFKGGKLELSQIGSRVDDVDFTFYSSDNAPPAAAPKIDF